MIKICSELRPNEIWTIDKPSNHSKTYHTKSNVDVDNDKSTSFKGIRIGEFSFLGSLIRDFALVLGISLIVSIGFFINSNRDPNGNPITLTPEGMIPTISPTETYTPIPPTATNTSIPPTHTPTPTLFFIEDLENNDYQIYSTNDLPNVESIAPNNSSDSAIRIPKTEISNDAWAVGTVWFPDNSGNVIEDSPQLVPGSSYIITVDVRSNVGVKCGVEFGHGDSGHPDNGGYVINRNIAGTGEWQTISLAALTTEINRLQVNLRTYTDNSFCDFDNITILERS